MKFIDFGKISPLNQPPISISLIILSHSQSFSLYYQYLYFCSIEFCPIFLIFSLSLNNIYILVYDNFLK